MVDRGVGADPEKKNLLSAASKVITLTPTIGTELHGIDLHQLSDGRIVSPVSMSRDHGLRILSRSLLVAERGVVCK